MKTQTSRRSILLQAPAAIAAPLALGETSAATTNRPFTAQGLNGCHLLPGAQFYVGIDGHGVWPNLTKLPDGSIVTAYYFGPKRPEWAAHGLPWHQRYHMGVAKWDLSLWPEED